MCRNLMVAFTAVTTTIYFGIVDVAVAGTIHQEYDGPWHWDELTRQTKSLDGKSAPVNGVWYPILEGTEYTGTAEITGSKIESDHLSIPSRISYRHWVKGPWGEAGVETLLSYQTNDFEVVSITAGNVVPGFQLKSWLKDISIPSSVTNIGHGAFYGCANLTNVSLHAQIDRIQVSTFLGTGLKTITIPESVTAIDYAAFNSCSNLCEIITPVSVKEIGEFAFGACYSLTNAVIMGATNICQGAFWKCYDLKSVSLPQTLKSLGDHAFGACTSLASIEIPDSVEYVHDHAFLGCTKLDRIVIGKCVNSYGFIGCGNTLEIHSPSVVEMVSASESVFEHVTNIVFGAEIKNIPESFYSHFPSYIRAGGSGQISEPDLPLIVLDGSLVSVQGIGLTTLDVPVTVTQIAETAFEDCLELREIIIPDSVTHIEAHAFHNCTNLERLVVGSGVEYAGTPLFAEWDEAGQTNRLGSSSLRELVVASPAFYDAMFRDEHGNWLGASYPAVTNVAFAGNGFEAVGWMGRFPALESVTIPGGVAQIEPYAFEGCANLKEVVIPDSVERVGEAAFMGCLSLERLVVGSGVEYAGTPLFAEWDEAGQTNRLGSSSLRELVVASPAFYDAMFRDEHGNWLGASYPAVTNVAFAGNGFEAVGWMGRFPALESVAIPDGVAQIEPYAFEGCANLKEVVIPDSVERVGEAAFMDCLSLERLVVGSGVTDANAPLFGEWDEVGQTNRLGSASLKELVVGSPKFYDAMFRNEYGNWLGASYPAVTNVAFAGDGFESVGNMGAFPALEAVTVPDGSYAIEPYAFAGCVNMKELAIPDSVEFVGEGAFMDCLSLERLVVGSGVTDANAPLFGEWDEDGQTNRLGSSSLRELVVGSPKFYDAMFRNEYGNWLGASYPAVTNVAFGWRFGDVPENIGYVFPSLTASSVEVAFPQISTGTEAEVGAVLSDALKDSRDIGLTNITDIATYNAFVNWAESVGEYGQSRNQALATVKRSSQAWLSFALGSSTLIDKEFSSDDVKIDSFTPDIGNGQFAFEVSIDGVDIGSGSVEESMLKTNLKKALGVEGATTLSFDAFSPDNIEIFFDAPKNGKACFIATPPADVGNSFFMRVKVKSSSRKE